MYDELLKLCAQLWENMKIRLIIKNWHLKEDINVFQKDDENFLRDYVLKKL